MGYSRKDFTLSNGNIPLCCKIRLSYFLNKSCSVDGCELGVGWRNFSQIAKAFRYTLVSIHRLVLVSAMLLRCGLFCKSYNLAR